MSEKLRYSEQELAGYKRSIELRITSAKNNLKNIKGKKVEYASFSDEEINGLVEREEKWISLLHKAVERCDNGTYGVCRLTGKLISHERLVSVPTTTLAIKQYDSDNPVITQPENKPDQLKLF